jgi:hypothetical protein
MLALQVVALGPNAAPSIRSAFRELQALPFSFRSSTKCRRCVRLVRLRPGRGLHQPDNGRKRQYSIVWNRACQYVKRMESRTRASLVYVSYPSPFAAVFWPYCGWSAFMGYTSPFEQGSRSGDWRCLSIISGWLRSKRLILQMGLIRRWWVGVV